MRGFTLLELVIVAALVGILVLAAMPSFSSTMDDLRVDAAARALIGHLRYGQSVAVTEAKLVAVQFLASEYYLAQIESIETASTEGKVTGTVLTDPITRRPMQFTSAGGGAFEGLAVLFAPGGRKGAKGPSVKPAHGGDDVGPPAR